MFLLAFSLAKYTCLFEINNFFRSEAISIQQGGVEYKYSNKWLDIYWPADEYIYIKLTEEDKSALNQDLESLKTAHSTKDVQAIDTASEKLNSTWGTISTRLYQETQSEPQVNTDTDTGNGLNR